MSTASGTSVGDSGTHSDPEDRRVSITRDYYVYYSVIMKLIECQ